MDPIARQGMESLKRPAAPQRRSAKTYTEADIARLEADDLTDPQVGTELLNAYYQNEPAQRDRLSLQRDVDVFAPNAALRATLAELEAIENPSADTRAERLTILTQLALRAKRNARARKAAANA